MADIPGGSGAGSSGDSKSSGGGGSGNGNGAGGDGDPGSSGAPSSSSSFRLLRFGCGAGGPITLEITTTTGRNFSVRTNSDQTVEQLKKTISKRLTVSKDRICLLYRERELHDGTLSENGLMDGSKIILTPNVETGLLAQRAENTVMQALESLNDNQVNDFLSGKSPLNLSVRLGDHMMLIQLQLSTLNPSSQSQIAGGAGGRPVTGGSNPAGSNVHVKPSAAGSSTSLPGPTQPNQAAPHLCSYHHYQQHLQRHQRTTVTDESDGNSAATAAPEVGHPGDTANPAPSQRSLLVAPGKPSVDGGGGKTLQKQHPTAMAPLLASGVHQASSSRTYLKSVIASASSHDNRPPEARHYVLLQDPPEAAPARKDPASSSGQGAFFTVGQSSEGGMVMLIQGASEAQTESEQMASANGVPAGSSGEGAGPSPKETADGTRHLVLIQDPAESASRVGSLAPTVYLLENQPASDDKINGGMYLLQRSKSLVAKRLFSPEAEQQPSGSAGAENLMRVNLPLTPPPSSPQPRGSGGKRGSPSQGVLIDELLAAAARGDKQPCTEEPAAKRATGADDPVRRRIARVVSTRSRPDGGPAGVYLVGDDVARCAGTTTPAGGTSAQSPIKSLSNLVSARMVVDDADAGGQAESSDSGSANATSAGGCTDPISANLTSCLCRRFDSGPVGTTKASDVSNLHRTAQNSIVRHKVKAHRPTGAATVQASEPYPAAIHPNGGVPTQQQQQQVAGAGTGPPRKHTADPSQWLAASASSSSLENPALAEASRNLTQTLRKLSKRVFTSKAKHDTPSHTAPAHTPSPAASSSAAGASASSATAPSASSTSASSSAAAASAAAAASHGRGGISSGAVIESMKHHGKGIYSGTFSGTLNPALQDKFGRPKRDISTIIHILNDLLSATPQCARTGATGTGASGRSSGAKMYLEQPTGSQQQQQSSAAGVGGNRATSSWLVPAPMSSSLRPVPPTLAGSSATKSTAQNVATTNRKGMAACGCDGSAAPCKPAHTSIGNPTYGRSLVAPSSGSSSTVIPGGRSVILSAAPGAGNPLSSGSKIVTVITPASATTHPPPAGGLPIVMCKCGAAMIKLLGGSGTAGVQCQSCLFREAELENSKMRVKLENLRLIMQRKKERREARRQKVAPYGGAGGGDGAQREQQPAGIALLSVGDGGVQASRPADVPMAVDSEPSFETAEPAKAPAQLAEQQELPLAVSKQSLSAQAQSGIHVQQQQLSPQSEQNRECQEQQQTPPQQLVSNGGSCETEGRSNEPAADDQRAGAESVAVDAAAASSSSVATAAAAAATPTATTAPSTASSSPTASTDAASSNANSNSAPHLVEEVDTVA
uniref:Ubiquitin-like domain-containing protein n=1 Tax=Anopheles dirus TaxID=7168 RepID=A0A182N071_9DIPT